MTVRPRKYTTLNQDLSFLANHTIELIINLFSKSVLNVHGLGNLKVTAFPMHDIELKVSEGITKETVTLVPESLVGVFKEIDATLETGAGVLMYCFDRFAQSYGICACYLMYK